MPRVFPKTSFFYFRKQWAKRRVCIQAPTGFRFLARMKEKSVWYTSCSIKIPSSVPAITSSMECCFKNIVASIMEIISRKEPL